MIEYLFKRLLEPYKRRISELEETNNVLRRMYDGSYRRCNNLEIELNDALMEIQRLNDKMRKRTTPRQWPVRFRN